MSTSNLTINTKKHKHGYVAGQILCQLQDYKEQELSPTSERLCNKLIETANKVVNDHDNTDEDLLEAAFELFEKKQKQVHKLVKEIEKLQADKNYSDALFEFGDWFKDILYHLGLKEAGVKKKDAEEFKKEYDEQNKMIIKQAEDEAKEEAEATGATYTGPKTFVKVNAHQQAKSDAGWECLEHRQVTSTHEKVMEEKAKIEQWRADGSSEESAPATPFLDRLQRMAEAYGISRTTALSWIKEYGERNNAAHNPPPEIGQYWIMIDKDGKKTEMEVKEKKDAKDGFDWESFKKKIMSYKLDVEAKYVEGKIDEKRREVFLSAIDAYWSLYSVVDDDGNEKFTEHATSKAGLAWEDLRKRRKTNPDPTEKVKSEYKEGKWDDI